MAFTQRSLPINYDRTLRARVYRCQNPPPKETLIGVLVGEFSWRTISNHSAWFGLGVWWLNVLPNGKIWVG